MPRYGQGGRSRYEFFMRSWAARYGLSVAQAKRSPAARGYYSEAYGRGRWRASRAWRMAGVIEFDEDRGEWRYVEDQ